MFKEIIQFLFGKEKDTRVTPIEALSRGCIKCGNKKNSSIQYTYKEASPEGYWGLFMNCGGCGYKESVKSKDDKNK